jgi:hypothetical protein
MKSIYLYYRTIPSSIADTVMSTLMKYQEHSPSWKSTVDIQQIKHIVDCSTTMKNTSLLSFFC